MRLLKIRLLAKNNQSTISNKISFVAKITFYGNISSTQYLNLSLHWKYIYLLFRSVIASTIWIIGSRLSKTDNFQTPKCFIHKTDFQTVFCPLFLCELSIKQSQRCRTEMTGHIELVLALAKSIIHSLLYKYDHFEVDRKNLLNFNFNSQIVFAR